MELLAVAVKPVALVVDGNVIECTWHDFVHDNELLGVVGCVADAGHREGLALGAMEHRFDLTS